MPRTDGETVDWIGSLGKTAVPYFIGLRTAHKSENLAVVEIEKRKASLPLGAFLFLEPRSNIRID